MLALHLGYRSACALLAACIGAAAIAWQSHGDAAKEMIARWAPQSDLTSSLAPKKPVPDRRALGQYCRAGQSS
jgi:hypothetical protein